VALNVNQNDMRNKSDVQKDSTSNHDKSKAGYKNDNQNDEDTNEDDQNEENQHDEMERGKSSNPTAKQNERTTAQTAGK